MTEFGDSLRRFCLRKTRWSRGKEHKLFEQEWTQLTEKQMNTTARTSNGTIKASPPGQSDRFLCVRRAGRSFSRQKIQFLEAIKCGSIWQGTVYLEAREPRAEGGQGNCSTFFRKKVERENKR
jgi:hypothetical protein